MEKKLKTNEMVIYLKGLVTKYNDVNKYTKIGGCLTGGAVIDIIEDRGPNDYDLKITNNQKEFERLLLEDGYLFNYETSTSRTFRKGGTKVQLLKTDLTGFEFTVSKSIVRLSDDYISLDKWAIENKTLIPQSFTGRDNIMNCLSRIPHWRRKGYEIKDETYFSLLNGLKETEYRLPYRS